MSPIVSLKWIHKGPKRKRERGVTMLMVMTVLAALIVATSIGVGIHQHEMRTTGYLNGQTALNGCAQAGLVAGTTFFLQNPDKWNTYLDTGYYITGTPYQATRPDLIYIAGISDNLDEFPPQANNNKLDHDQRVVLRSECTDPQSNQHVYLTAVLTMENLRPGGGLQPRRGAYTYTTSADFTNNGALAECNGCGFIDPDINMAGGRPDVVGAGGAGSVQNNQGIMAMGVRLSHDEISLAERTAYPFLWLPGSAEGTISKFNTNTGQEVARYRTAPKYGNPSRTTVDLRGNVWVSNRSLPGGERIPTITKIGLLEAGECVDRNNNGVIDTSRAANDVKPWGGGWLDGVAKAQDECILLYVPLSHPDATTPTDARMLAIDSDNNLYAGGLTSPAVYHIRGTDGTILKARNTRQGHYGGVLDRKGYIWSMHVGSGKVEKIAPDLASSQLFSIGHPGYAISIDINGRIWTSSWTPKFSRIDTDGTNLQVFTQQDGCCAQGITTDANGDVYLAGSLSSDHVGHYKNDGRFVRNYKVGKGPTGVAVDAAGKVWAAGYTSTEIAKINPKNGEIEQTVRTGVHSYTYSDATGYVVRTMTAPQGTWTVTQYCGRRCTSWESIGWDAAVFDGTEVKVRARSAASVNLIPTANWVDLTNKNGAILPANGAGSLQGPVVQVEVTLKTSVQGKTPVVYSVSINPR